MKLPKKTIALLVIFAFTITLYVGFTTIPNQNAYPQNSLNSGLGLTSKIDPNLISMMENGTYPNSYTTNMIVMFSETDFGSGVQVLNSTFPDIKINDVYNYIPAVAIQAPLSDVEKIASLPQVSKVWYDYPIQLESTSLGQLSLSSDGVAYDPAIENLWSMNLTGSGIIVALLDSGIDTTHPDLSNLGNNSNVTKVVANVSMVPYDPYTYDLNGQGTYVAGIIAGTGNASNGTYEGIAPQAQLFNVKVFDSEGLSLTSWILSGVEWSVSHGADIIVLPFAGPGYPDDPLCTEIDEAVQSGVTVIAAAGDDGPAYTSVGSPGMGMSAITVGSYNTSSGLVCTNSSRGPSLFMWMEPDIVAPGYNITSCRASVPNLGINISLPYLPSGGFGNPLDEYYTTATGTLAAAGYVAGVAALLLQAFPFINPETLKVAMMKTAINLGEDPNTQGAGLLDPNATYNYLLGLAGPLENISRVYTPALPYTGFFFTNDTTSQLSTYCLVGAYGTFVGMQTQNLTSGLSNTHMLLGQFGVNYNGLENVTLFMLTTVYREMHTTTVPGLDYQRALTVLGNENLLIVIAVDCWNNTNATGAFRITITLINIGSTPLYNVSLLTYWNIDLFLNETNHISYNYAQYNSTDDLIYANNSNTDYPTEQIYVGFEGNIPSTAHEVGDNNTVFNDYLNGQLNNNSAYDGNTGLAMEWNLTGQLDPGNNVGFEGALGVGGNYDQMQEAAANILAAPQLQNNTDLCVVNASFERTGEVYTPYPSESLILNIGNTVTNATVFFFSNTTTNGSSVIYSEIYQYQNLQPFAFEEVSTNWEPTTSGVYTVGWAITTLSTSLTLDQLLSGNLSLNTSETYLLDNFLARDVFIGMSPNCSILFPTTIPNEPFELNFPLDFAYSNLTVVSSYPLENVQVSYSGNATQFFNGTPTVIIEGNYANILISFNITAFPHPGYYNGTINVTADGELIGNVSINFNLTYPEGGRLFFDNIHNEISLTSWNRRLYDIYSGYFQFSDELFKQGTDINEIPFLTGYNSTLLSFYDGIVIFDPLAGYSPQDIATIQSFLNNGTGVLICVDPENECNWTAVNMITQPYGITVVANQTEPITITSANMSQSSPVTSNLSSIEMDYAAILDVNTSLGAEALANTTNGTVIAAANVGYGKLLVIGDAAIFDSSHLNLLDNSLLASNAVNWLLSNTMTLNVELSLPNPDGKLYIGDNFYASIHVTDRYGQDISSNITMYTIFVLPNGSIFPMFAFHYQGGWYTTFFFTYFTNVTGDYSMVIYAHANNYTTTYYVYNFEVDPAGPAVPPLFYFPQASREYAIFGFTFLGVIVLIVGTAYLLERRRLRKKTLIPEFNRDLRNTIRNAVNEVRAVNKEIDRELSRKDIDDFDRIRIIHEKLGKLRKALDRARNVAERVGE